MRDAGYSEMIEGEGPMTIDIVTHGNNIKTGTGGTTEKSTGESLQVGRRISNAAQR